MKHSDFREGLEFCCGGRRWRCTDVGRRTIVAICLEPHTVVVSKAPHIGAAPVQERQTSSDSSWFNGPPYAVAEEVFDEDDIEACSLEGDET